MANTKPVELPWVGLPAAPVDPITGYEWELYDLKNDPTQSNNIVSPDDHADLHMKRLGLVRMRYLACHPE
jgi:hypothetical protein